MYNKVSVSIICGVSYFDAVFFIILKSHPSDGIHWLISINSYIIRLLHYWNHCGEFHNVSY